MNKQLDSLIMIPLILTGSFILGSIWECNTNTHHNKEEPKTKVKIENYAPGVGLVLCDTETLVAHYYRNVTPSTKTKDVWAVRVQRCPIGGF